ncbi:MAG TPA: hypothetical protein VMS64_34475 [Candidatus Methylomirabilis sp.]|nr:hypothetical protein [Candidatus Methylomirabilis sp.]
MKTHSQRLILVATDEGLHVVDSDGANRVDDLAGRSVLALAIDGGGAWALVGGHELWRSADGRHWSLTATMPKRKATCLASTPAGLFVGTTRAHLLRLEQDRLVSVPSFDDAEGRDAWYTPWGAPADVRSMSAEKDGTLYVNVHVGGILRSTDGGNAWRPMLDIEEDVHQVFATPGRPGLVLAAAAAGFGVSRDRGDTWRWDNAGLHAHYCRAVTLADDTVLLSASAGHHGRRAALYRRPVDGSRPFERCDAGLPEWFSDNLDTGCLTALGSTVAIGTEDGCVFVSRDHGERWDAVVKGLAPVRAVALR